MTKSNVVIPLDGSSYSQKILASIRKLLPPEQNRLTLLRVCKDSNGLVALAPSTAAMETNLELYPSHNDALRAQHPIYATQIQASQRAEVMAELQETIRALELHGYDVELEVTFGEPAEEIVNFVNFTPVDLVAMTTHGRTGLSKMLFGNVAEALLRRVNVPVLILRPFER